MEINSVIVNVIRKSILGGPGSWRILCWIYGQISGLFTSLLPETHQHIYFTLCLSVDCQAISILKQ